MPTPKAGESQQEWMSRCIPQVKADKTASSQEQAVAICLSMWKKREADDMSIRLDYDARRRRALLTYPDGKELALANVSEEQAKAFLERHAAEFGKRGLCLTTPTIDVVRGHE